MTTVAIIQARTGSTRLPNKIFAPILGKPVLQHVVERVQRATLVDDLVIATTTNADDTPVAALAQQLNVACVRGSEADVLDRYQLAAHTLDLTPTDVIVRITADCPCIDPQLIDAVVAARAENDVDYCSNVLERCFPRGLDVEAFTARALMQAWRDTRDPAEREHVTLYLVRHAEFFSQFAVTQSGHDAQWRWTIDTPEDLTVVNNIFMQFGHNQFTWAEAAALCRAQPDLMAANAHIAQKIP